MNSPQGFPILLNLIAAGLGALGQYLYKLGASRLGTVPLFKNGALFLGMFLFCAVMLLFVQAFKMGGRLSITYPVYATTFLWGTLLAVWLDKEPFHWVQGVGMFVLLSGILLITLAAPK